MKFNLTYYYIQLLYDRMEHHLWKTNKSIMSTSNRGKNIEVFVRACLFARGVQKVAGGMAISRGLPVNV